MASSTSRSRNLLELKSRRNCSAAIVGMSLSFPALHPTDGKVRVTVGEESLKLRREQLRKVILILLAGSSYTQYNIICADDQSKLSESKFCEVCVCIGRKSVPDKHVFPADSSRSRADDVFFAR